MESYGEILRVLYFGWIMGTFFMLSILTFFIYLRIREHSFLYYALYTTFLNIYIFFQAARYIYYPINQGPIEFIVVANWPVQFVYYLLYTQFIRTFFNFKINNPPLDRIIHWFIWGMGAACLLFTVLDYTILSDTVADFSRHMIRFVLFFYIPVFVPFAIYVLFQVSKSRHPAKYYIIIGSSVYVLSALTAMYFTMAKTISFAIGIFMAGVLLEFIFFAIALGIKVYQLFIEKNEYQQKLIDQLEANRKLTEYNNKMLTDQVELFAKKEIELELKNSINRLQAKVFRSQMNSHFIFNTLNAIKATIINNNQEKSVDQLNKFSKLVRNILNHSLEEIVTLEKEIEITRLYTFLENLRLNDQIDFNLKIDPSIATNSIKIPPFIIQPFIENAIWHGLAHKKGKKTVAIEIKKETDKLCIVIKDNGIGMLKAMEIRKKKSIQHKSMGISITKDRLQLFTKNEEKEYGLTFENLGSEEKSKGTRVTIKLPLRT